MRRTGIISLGCGLLLFCAVGLQARTQSAPQVDAPAPAMDGPTLFRERGCVQCHQIRGVGGTKGPDLSGVGRRLKDTAINHQIVSGGIAMPPFGGALSSEDIATLVKYLQHCRDKTPPVTKPAPTAAAPGPVMP